MTVSKVVIITLSCVFCSDNGLVRTPPMGWNSWKAFGCQVDCKTNPNGCISEKVIERTADKLASEGWRELGYKYVILDDCWLARARDSKTNKLLADPTRFPHGMKKLGEYIHSKGLLFGITINFGIRTCSGYPGSMNFLDLDAKSIAEWEVDYVKMNACKTPTEKLPDGFQNFSKLLNATGTPVVLMCNYASSSDLYKNPNLIDWKKAQDNCNLFRVVRDVARSWSSVLSYLNDYRLRNAALKKAAGPGHWNDPDTMVLGHSGLSDDHKRVHMGMWCMFAAPLIISADMNQLDNVSASLLRNKHLLNIDQDKGGHIAEYITMRNDVQMWIRKLDECPVGWAIACVYTKVGGGSINFHTSLDEFKSPTYTISGERFELMDVFTGVKINDVALTEKFQISINPTGISMIRVKPYTIEYSYV